jgi:sugar-specific transcriptional regulator TrmB
MLKLEPSEGPNDPLDIGSSAAVSSGSQLIRTIEAMIRMTVSMHMNQQRAYQQIIQEQRREITELRSRERDIQSTAHRIMTQQIADIREESPPNPALEKLVALGEKLAPMIIDRVTTPGAEE